MADEDKLKMPPCPFCKRDNCTQFGPDTQTWPVEYIECQPCGVRMRARPNERFIELAERWAEATTEPLMKPVELQELVSDAYRLRILAEGLEGKLKHRVK